jgi:CRP-like cAMP-binding protein
MLKTLAEDEAFGEVPAPVLQSLVEASELHIVPKGTIIYESGERWGHLAFVVDGSIAMFARGADGKEHLYEQMHPGQFFGISAMFDGEAEMARTEIVSASACYAAVDRAAVLALCRRHGLLAIAFARSLARRVRRTTSLLAEQMNFTAQERIARYLLRFTGGQGMAPALDPLPLMTQTQIGAAAGTVKDVAARAIAHFEKQGALKRERGHIRWLNREALVQLARFTEALHLL